MQSGRINLNYLCLSFQLFWLIILFQFVSQSQQQNVFPSSPCPNVFLYKYNGQEWYGELKAPATLIFQQQPAMLKVTFEATNVSLFVCSWCRWY